MRCRTKIAEAKTTVPMLGHDWGKWTPVGEQEGNPAHYERVCKNDSSHVERRDIDPPAIDALEEIDEVSATCNQAGNKKHWLYEAGNGEGQGGDETQAGFVNRYFVEITSYQNQKAPSDGKPLSPQMEHSFIPVGKYPAAALPKSAISSI